MQPAEYCLFYAQTMCMPRSDWAAWVEAIGGLLAVFAAVAAIWNTNHYWKRQKSEEWEVDQDRRTNMLIRATVTALPLLDRLSDFASELPDRLMNRAGSGLTHETFRRELTFPDCEVLKEPDVAALPKHLYVEVLKIWALGRDWNARIGDEYSQSMGESGEIIKVMSGAVALLPFAEQLRDATASADRSLMSVYSDLLGKGATAFPASKEDHG